MICCTGNICTFSHREPACECKGYHYLQMFWDIGHKTFDLPLFFLPHLPGCLSWLLRKLIWRWNTKYHRFPFLQLSSRRHCDQNGCFFSEMLPNGFNVIITIIMLKCRLNPGIFTATQSPPDLSRPKTNFFPFLWSTFLETFQVT